MTAALAPASHRGAVPSGCPLTVRELQTIQLIANGASRREAADRLGLQLSSIRTYLGNAYARLGVASASQAAVRCWREGWIQIDGVHSGTGQLAAAVNRLATAVVSEEKSSLSPSQRAYLHAFEDYLYARTDESRLAARRRMDQTARQARITPHPERPARELMDTLVLLTRRGWARR